MLLLHSVGPRWRLPTKVSISTNAGQELVWRDAVQAACATKLGIDPDAALPNNERVSFNETSVQVTTETMLGASLRLVEPGLQPLALNFANGVHPGGASWRCQTISSRKGISSRTASLCQELRNKCDSHKLP
jgi:hypothetical protein